MATSIDAILNLVEHDAQSARFLIKAARLKMRDAPDQLAELTDERTEAFVDLAKHYLPELSHQSLANAWAEVRHKIRDVLLVRDDLARQHRRRIDALEARKDDRVCQREAIAKDLEKARLDLMSKTGNAEKVLRENPRVAACIEAIEDVDAEIEQAITALEYAQSDAAKKLPDYEASSLFGYLRERHFGTPEYDGRGLERRYDRWLAKLINYREAKASYDHLTTVPKELQRLVEEKRARYQDLLEQLSDVRRAAMHKFSVGTQELLWEQLAKDLQANTAQIETIEHEIHVLENELATIEHVTGEHYQTALEIYREFLTTLDADILKVYAACTSSPVDDEICARLRGIEDEIASVDNDTQWLRDEVAGHQKQLAGLAELAGRLRRHQQESNHLIECVDEASVRAWLDQLRDRRMTPAQIWQGLRGACVKPLRRRLGLNDPERDQSETLGSDVVPSEAELGPVEATFLAASGFAAQPKGHRPTDPLDIVLVDEDAAPTQVSGFRMFAFCRTRHDAFAVTRLLDAHGIRAFLHNHEFGRSPSSAGIHGLEEIVVMVDPRRYSDAVEVIRSLQASHLSSWVCSQCNADVDAGYQVCWQCELHRVTAFAR